MLKKELEQELNRTKLILDYAKQEIKEKGKEIERLQKDLTYYQEYSADLLNKNNTFENIIKEAKEFIYENAYDSERQNCIDDLWGEIPKLLEILKGSDKEC